MYVYQGMLQRVGWPVEHPTPRAHACGCVCAVLCPTQVIVSTNRGEPLVLQKKLSLSGIAFENAARRLIGKTDFFIDLDAPQKGFLQQLGQIFT